MAPNNPVQQSIQKNHTELWLVLQSSPFSSYFWMDTKQEDADDLPTQGLASCGVGAPGAQLAARELSRTVAVLAFQALLSSRPVRAWNPVLARASWWDFLLGLLEEASLKRSERLC